MAKEWILNSAMNRFQLNFKRNVGAVSEEIRKCCPKTVEQWREYYFSNVREESHIEELGRRLYVKITEVISSEVEEITERDCVDYMLALVIERTFDGYETEIKTIYGQLEKQVGQKIEPAPDEWDRAYNVDFFIKTGEKFIGIQIKPVSDVSHIPEIYKERSLQEKSHLLFKEKFGGEVFFVFSMKKGGNKTIHNTEVIEDIRQEIRRLQGEEGV
ncbi:MAG: MjaI family restriction endonuclease [Candidatus Dadabacteria bacterium]|nr:MjaI family restriction endonuclease [Candidatus Dadabacteria bacterium]